MRSKVKLTSCCNAEAYVYVLEAPVLKELLKLIEDAGFIALKHFLKSGILSCRKKGLLFTVTFGQTKMTTRCSGSSCASLWDELDSVIKKIES